MSKNRRVPDTSPKRPTEQRSEVIGVVGLGISLFLLIAMISLQAHALVMGPFGRSVASLYYGLAGVCGYLLIALGAIAAVRMLLDREPIVPMMIWLGCVLGVISLAMLVHLIAPHYRVAGHGPGGALGEHLAEISRAMISTAGTALLALVGLVVAVVIATPLRMRDVLRAIGAVLRTVGRAWRAAGTKTTKTTTRSRSRSKTSTCSKPRPTSTAPSRRSSSARNPTPSRSS